MARKKTALKKSGAAKKGKTAKPKKSTGSRKKFYLKNNLIGKEYAKRWKKWRMIMVIKELICH